MIDQSNEIALCAEWMRWRAECQSRPDAQRAAYAMAADWLAAWAKSDLTIDDLRLQSFISQFDWEHECKTTGQSA